MTGKRIRPFSHDDTSTAIRLCWIPMLRCSLWKGYYDDSIMNNVQSVSHKCVVIARRLEDMRIINNIFVTENN